MGRRCDRRRWFERNLWAAGSSSSESVGRCDRRRWFERNLWAAGSSSSESVGRCDRRLSFPTVLYQTLPLSTQETDTFTYGVWGIAPRGVVTQNDYTNHKAALQATS
jgi:hypothetical protein